MKLYSLLLVCSHILASVADSALVKFEDWHHQRIHLKDVQLHLRWAGSGPPLVLVHGFPQHSLTWHTIGPILAQHYTVICPDNRGMGASTIPASRDYTSETVSEDLKAVLDFLKIDQAYVLGHDKGAPLVAALAYKYPQKVKRIIFAEMMLPAFGFEELHTPKPWWDTYQNWHLALYLVPEVAAFLISGRVKELLTWYLWHGSYSGVSVLPHDHLESYTRELSKPGYLEAGFGYFKSIWQDAAYFNATIKKHPLQQPILVLGGEANFAPASYLQESYDPVGVKVEVDVVPHAGHWLGEENPAWTAQRIRKFLLQDAPEIPSIDLSDLINRVTLFGADKASEDIYHRQGQGVGSMAGSTIESLLGIREDTQNVLAGEAS